VIVIKGGTTGDTPLCRRCKHATLLQGHAEAKERLYCHHLVQWMPFEAHRCSSFVEKGSLSLWDMQQIAYRVAMDPKKKGQLGFFCPKDWKQHEDFKHEPDLIDPIG
jgi:hypothetical protein